MPTDTWYGQECEARIGLMADATTDPTSWEYLAFIRLDVTPQRERRRRPQIGPARHNVLDPIKGTQGFSRLSAALVVDLDARRTARLLRMGLGAPSTTGPASGLYTHVWNSGSKATQYFALQIRTAADQVRIYRGLTIATLGLAFNGENTRDFDLNIGLRGLSWARLSDWLGSTPGSSLVSESLIHRGLFKIDGVAVTNTLDISINYDRQLAEDIFLSTTPTIQGLRPNGGVHTGTATFRAVGEELDDMEEGETVFAAAAEMQGVTSGHKITFEHPQAMLNAPPLSIGEGLIERSISWDGHQDSADPAFRLTIVNNVASYAT